MHKDIKTLIQVLELIARVLEWVVNKSGLIDTKLQPLFVKSLPQVKTQLSLATAQLRSIASKDNPLYKDLQTYGLTGDPLKLKTTVGKSVLKEVSDSFVTSDKGPRIPGFKIKRPLEWFNSILGSLALVFPPLEAVKEYKENVELAIKERESKPEWGYKRIFDLR